jgi:AraC family transcriptional activator of pobA
MDATRKVLDFSVMLPPSVPTFFLYGEPVRDAGERFLHVEPLDVRSRPANWTIEPHAHQALNQLFVILRGGGTMAADGRRLPFVAPALLLVASRTVHGFLFDAGTTGQVLTIGEPYWLDLATRQPVLRPLFDGTAAAPMSRPDARRLDLLLRQVMTENAWAAPGHEAALDALTLLALVVSLRAVPRPAIGNSGQAQLVARFRQLVEQHFRRRPKLSFYSSTLRVSDGQLRRACLAAARQTPLRLVQERTVLEAKRMLLYSNKSAEEIAFTLGFEDPAYFSRFFHAMAGCNVRAFRARL